MRIRKELSPEATWGERILAALHELGPATVREIACWIGETYQPGIDDCVSAEVVRMRTRGELYLYSGSRTPTPGAPPKGKPKRWWITAHKEETWP